MDRRKVLTNLALGVGALPFTSIASTRRTEDHESNEQLKNNSIIIDVSCDEKMGFPFAKPTTFDSPGFLVNKRGAYYYAVDHTPSLYWNTSSHELSSGLLPYLEHIAKDKGYKNDPVLENALEIEGGNIINTAIFEFQNRTSSYPHSYVSESY